VPEKTKKTKCPKCGNKARHLSGGNCLNCAKLEAFQATFVQTYAADKSQQRKDDTRKAIMASKSAVASFSIHLASLLSSGKITYNDWEGLFEKVVKVEFKKVGLQLNAEDDGFYKAAVKKMYADHDNHLGEPDSMVEAIGSSLMEEFILMWLQPG
jgi:hypothetical protein